MICNNSVYIPYKLYSDFITKPCRSFMFSAALALQRDDQKTHTHTHTHNMAKKECSNFFNAVRVITKVRRKCRLLYLKTQSVPRCKHFSSRLKKQSVYAVSGTSRCLFSDKYKTHKYTVGKAYSC